MPPLVKCLAALAALLVASAACGGSTGPTPRTDIGITTDTILLGNTTALSGPASANKTISYAANAYFNYVNGGGGINGRKITLKILDDAYTATTTTNLTHQLVEQDKVFAIYGGLGTQPQAAVREYMNTNKVPQIFVFSGATTWSADYGKFPWTIGWIPSYQVESHIFAKDILANHPNGKVGVLYQNDDYGKDYLKGLTDGLGANASMIVDQESYEPAAASPALQIGKLKAKGVDTVLLFTTPTFTVMSLAGITGLGWAPTIYVNSGANPSANMAKAKAAGAALKNVTSASYLKDPSDPRWANDAGIRLYKQIIGTCASCDANNDFNISGVAGAYTMVDVLKQAGSNMTRQNVMNIAATRLNETNPFALPGIVIRTTPTDHFPISQMQIETWSGTAWTLQGGLVDVRGAIK